MTGDAGGAGWRRRRRRRRRRRGRRPALNPTRLALTSLVHSGDMDADVTWMSPMWTRDSARQKRPNLEVKETYYTGKINLHER
jgi:hypothetical protein